jgi:predicted outer membrane repeat protein
VIRDNDACQHGGGGLWVTGGAPVFENVRITGNAAVEEYGVTWGGGAWLDDTDASFTNVVIASNQSWGISASYGGGVYVDDGNPTFTNVVIKGNTAETSGGGVYVDSRGPTFRYSDIYGNSPDDTSGFADPTGTDGNVSVNPDFYDAALHLDTTSPLVDAGDPSILDPDGSTSDIGWFGGPGADLLDLDGDGWPSWWLPGPYDATSSPGLDCDDEDDAIYPGSGC